METGKTVKYLKYAIGEILLVVIGILIALQINNWNEQKVKIEQLKKDLVIVLQNLDQDTEQLNNNVSNGKIYVNYHLNILTSTNDSLYKPELLIAHLGQPNIDRLDLGYKNLISNNTFPFISDDNLKNNLSLYYESNLERIEFYSEKMSEHTNSIGDYLLEHSTPYASESLKSIIKKLINNPVFKEKYDSFTDASSAALLHLEKRLTLSSEIKKQIQTELEKYD